MRVCAKCGVDDSIVPFVKDEFICKPCNKIRRQIYYNNNKEKIYLKTKEWRDNHPEQDKATRRRSFVKRTFGITVDEYDQMFINQDGRCAICRMTQIENCNLDKRLSIDHSHSGDQSVRALLCDKCNRGLGFFNDNTEILLAASQYIAYHANRKAQE